MHQFHPQFDSGTVCNIAYPVPEKHAILAIVAEGCRFGFVNIGYAPHAPLIILPSPFWGLRKKDPIRPGSRTSAQGTWLRSKYPAKAFSQCRMMRAPGAQGLSERHGTQGQGHRHCKPQPENRGLRSKTGFGIQKCKKQHETEIERGGPHGWIRSEVLRRIPVQVSKPVLW